jgi:hypothetical protein
MPTAASSCVPDRFLRVLTYTLYGDVRVLIPVMPRRVGNWVEMMVMLAAVTKADIGTYGMNSMTQPRRKIPSRNSTAPARNDTV